MQAFIGKLKLWSPSGGQKAESSLWDGVNGITREVQVTKYQMGLLESRLQINVRLHGINVEARWMVNHNGKTEGKKRMQEEMFN